QQDAVDILVDLTMHSANNRLLTFARKPAPVQASYLAYCSTTGLGTMDFRLSDPYLDPPGVVDRDYSEETIWLPGTYWCYQPMIPDLPVSPLPAARAGYITFGCMNSFSKLSDRSLAVWCRLVSAVPESRLLVHAHPGSHRDRVRASFIAYG